VIYTVSSVCAVRSVVVVDEECVLCTDCFIGIYHNPLCLFLRPVIMTVLLCIMLHSSCEKVTLQPASHIFATDMSEWFFIPGRMYPCFTVLGNGMSSSHACDDCKVDWSGKVTWIG
jgi:hypothetical protein